MAAGMAGQACPPPPCHAAHATAAPRDLLPPEPCPLLLPRAAGSRSSAPRCPGIGPVLARCTLCHQYPALLHPGAGCSPPAPPRHGSPGSVHHGGTVAPILVMFPFLTPSPTPAPLLTSTPSAVLAPLPSSPPSSPHTPTLRASLPFPAHVSTHACSLSLSPLPALLVTGCFHFPRWPCPAHPASCSFSCQLSSLPHAPGLLPRPQAVPSHRPAPAQPSAP